MIPHKLLLLEDNSAVEQIVELALETENIEVKRVRNLQQAIEQLKDNPPDIIVADEVYPPASIVRHNARLAHIPIILLRSAFRGGEKPSGYDGVLDKPLQPQVLLDLIRNLLDNPPDGSSLSLDQYFDRLDTAFRNTEAAGDSFWARGDAQWPFATVPVPPPTEASPLKSAPRISESPSRPETVPDRAAPTVEISEEFVDRVAERVFQRLGDRMVRSTATEVVARLSKWLVANEVEKERKRKSAT